MNGAYVIPDFLQTIAEISIGLAGFSGLIVALRKSPGPLTDVQKFRLKVLFGNAFGAMFLSLLPYLLQALRVPETRLWFDCAATMLAFSLIFVIWTEIAGRRIARLVPEIFNWTIFYTLTGGHAVVVILQVTVMIGLVDSRAAGVYAIGLTWYLLHATYQFSRMLFILPKNPKHV